MGVELQGYDFPVGVVEDGYLSDSEAFASVINVINGVRMAPSLVPQSNKEQYDYLVTVVNPGKRIGQDDEALTATALKALSRAVFRLDAVYHGSLLNNIFMSSIWDYGLDARNALLELITALATVPDKFLDNCLYTLLHNLRPPSRLKAPFNQSKRWLMRKEEVRREVYLALNCINTLVPLAPARLKILIEKCMPRFTEDKYVLMTYVEGILELERNEIGKFLGRTVLARVVDLLIDLDVNIPWEDILQEEPNKGIFAIELGECNEDDEYTTIPNMDTLGLVKNTFADKLDGLMLVACEHLKSCSESGHLLEVFERLSEIFQRAMLKLHKSKFTQFLMFYACSLDPDTCGLKFAIMLTDIFISKDEDPDSRMKAIAYLASYLARAKFIPSSLVASILKRLVDWCFEYCQLQDSWVNKISPQADRVFYSGCQAVMYILCFRLRSICDVPQLKQLLFHLPVDSILHHPVLDPLKVCLPLIVQEFLRQAQTARLFKKPMAYSYDNSLESEFSMAFGGIQRLDMFFPFDPYLLKESDRFMRPNFEFWDMVKTTYSDYDSSEGEDSEGEDELKDLGPSNFPKDNDDEDDLDLKIDKMSITPNPSFLHQIATNFDQSSQMPARIRPSQSPPSPRHGFLYTKKEERLDDQKI
ncbi:RNA polymerase I-specific transcription initiation factor rrn3-like [Zingiber officinale]|uniref:RNA polymerase I-specific transcription initiation factor rrn3-like n=1 Tax=Zingiber officinale TaxID=94328 RepID=UPI001C4D158F|nr:RNA polymerase I-specific transcription initiation factor rrn3-like [Zingiber officinale]XP_042472225.1 RNA polymerase I-specific transcription initiation factor rrn3-like [Zingiber officinale]